MTRWEFGIYLFVGLTIGLAITQTPTPADPQEQQILALEDENSRLRGIIGDAFDVDYEAEAVFSLVVTATAYTARAAECNSEPWVTSSGTPSRVGAIAISRNLEKLGIGLGDLVIIKGMGLFRVEDRMNARWTNRIDILHGNLEAAKLFGVTQVEIMWVDKKEE